MPADSDITGASISGTTRFYIKAKEVPPTPPEVAPSRAGGRPSAEIEVICNNNSICEPWRGETIENCPHDCLVPEVLEIFYIGNLDINSEYLYKPELGEQWIYTYHDTNRTFTILEKGDEYLYMEHEDPSDFFVLGLKEKIDIDVDSDGKDDVFLYLENFNGTESILILGLTEEFFRVVRFRFVDIWTIIVFILLISITILLLVGYKNRRGPKGKGVIACKKKVIKCNKTK
jgi:hypothetical protein